MDAPPQMISFECDVGWYRAVVQGVPLPEVWRKVETPEVIRQWLRGELTKWNSALQGEVKRFRPLCQPNDIHSKGMVSILIALVLREGYEQVICDGVDICGVCIAMFHSTGPGVSLGTKTLASMFSSWPLIVLVLSLSLLFLLALPFFLCCPFPFPTVALGPCSCFCPPIFFTPLLFVLFLPLSHYLTGHEATNSQFAT